MMAGSYGDAFLIENGSHIVRMHAFYHERKHTGFFLRGSNDAHAGYRGNFPGGILEQLVLVLRNVLHAEMVEIFERRTHSDRARHVRSSGFELVWNLVVNRLLEADRADHLSPALIGRHGVKQRKFSVQDSDAGRTKLSTRPNLSGLMSYSPAIVYAPLPGPVPGAVKENGRISAKSFGPTARLSVTVKLKYEVRYQAAVKPRRGATSC